MILAFLSGVQGARNPRHHAVEHQDHVGLAEPRPGFETEIHRMAGGHVEVTRLGLHHRDREFLRQRLELDDGLRIAADARRHDQRKRRLGDEVRRLLDGAARGGGRGGPSGRTVLRRACTAGLASTSRQRRITENLAAHSAPGKAKLGSLIKTEPAGAHELWIRRETRVFQLLKCTG